MIKSALVRQTIVLVLSTIVLSAILVAVIYIVIAQIVFVETRAKELIPLAQNVADALAEDYQNPMNAPLFRVQGQFVSDARIHIFDANGESMPFFRNASPLRNHPATSSRDRNLRYQIRNNDDLVDMIKPHLDDVLEGQLVNTTSKSAHDKMDYLIVGVPVHGADSILGAVILTKSLSELRVALNGLNLSLLWSMVGAFILMLLPSYYVAKKMVVPINQMKNAAISIANGDFTISANESYKNEIGELAAALNYMSGELSKLEQTRRDYVSNVSHELRTPLASIRAMSETLIDGMVSDPDTITRYHSNILREAMRLSRLINDLLELSRLQSGTLALEKKEIDLKRILSAVAGLYKIIASDADIGFDFIEDHNLPMAYSNADRIEQVLNILLDNAIKFTDCGGTVSLSTTLDNGKILVTVSDTGIGIDEQDIENVFDRFYKSDRSHSSEGTGLGLSIAYEILALLGESITVASTLGKGSSFTFSVTTHPQ